MSNPKQAPTPGAKSVGALEWSLPWQTKAICHTFAGSCSISARSFLSSGAFRCSGTWNKMAGSWDRQTLYCGGKSTSGNVARSPRNCGGRRPRANTGVSVFLFSGLSTLVACHRKTPEGGVGSTSTELNHLTIFAQVRQQNLR